MDDESESEFEQYDFSEFTAHDLACFDARATLFFRKSPYAQFCAWKNGFSVTDLVSPLWCEVQYEYGLHAARSKPLNARPSAFLSREGKQINVQQNVARQNDKTLKAGASIHKALERQVRPHTVPVRITTEEERWALRLFNLTAGLQQLLLEGRTRELPVFGITHGHVVFGIIDDVTQHFLHTTPDRGSVAEQLPSQVHASPSQKFIPNRLHQNPTFYDLTLVDYKTRRSQSLPPDEDTISSQLQLMLYHRLLSALLLPESFDFDALWEKQGINPHRSFSLRFVQDIGWSTGNEADPECHVDLSCMVAAWISLVHLARSSHTQLRGLNSELQIIYRKATLKKHSFHNARTIPNRQTQTADKSFHVLALQEELDVAHAIEESLRPLGQQAGDASTSNQAVVQNNTSAPSEELTLHEVVTEFAVNDSLLTNAPEYKAQLKQHKGTPGADASSDVRNHTILSDRHGDPIDEDASSFSAILGSKKFLMNDKQLDAHLEDILQWWFGIRPPRGVELTQSGRCFTCEYRDGCEWREKKAFGAAIALEKRMENEA